MKKKLKNDLKWRINWLLDDGWELEHDGSWTTIRQQGDICAKVGTAPHFNNKHIIKYPT